MAADAPTFVPRRLRPAEDSAPPEAAPAFVPRWQREQTEREEALRGGLYACVDHIADQDEVIAGLHRIVVMLCQIMDRRRADAEAASDGLDIAMDAVAAFEERVRAGDVDGAVVALRCDFARWCGLDSPYVQTAEEAVAA